MKLRRVIAVVGRLIVVIAACISLPIAVVAGYGLYESFRYVSFKDVATDRIVLLDGIESYIGVAELERLLKARGLKWVVSVSELSDGQVGPGCRPGLVSGPAASARGLVSAASWLPASIACGHLAGAGQR